MDNEREYNLTSFPFLNENLGTSSTYWLYALICAGDGLPRRDDTFEHLFSFPDRNDIWIQGDDFVSSDDFRIVNQRCGNDDSIGRIIMDRRQ